MRGTPGALMLATALFVIGLVAELTWPHSLERNTATERPAAAPEPVVLPADDHARFLSDYGRIHETPLFTPDRRPYVVPVEQPQALAAAPPPPRVNFRLSAIISAPNTQIALLSTDRARGVTRVAVGEQIEGWTLSQVQPDGVVLRRGVQSITVELHPDRESGGTRSGTNQ